MSRARVVRTLVCGLIAIPVLAAGCGGSESKANGASGPRAMDAANFSATVNNPWFPLKPGTSWVYRGVKDRKRARDVFTVTHRTKVVGGTPTIVVRDLLFLNGRLAERTSDYYTQDRRGNVWYFGEDTAELDARGKVTSTEGTWHAGSHGARPGIFMEAHPKVGHVHGQEFYKRHAEDHYKVLSLHARVTVPYGRFRGAQLTREWTPLEPGVVDHKYYVRGVGEVAEKTVRGGDEELLLVKRSGG